MQAARNARVYASDFCACMQVSFVLVFNDLFCSNFDNDSVAAFCLGRLRLK